MIRITEGKERNSRATIATACRGSDNGDINGDNDDEEVSSNKDATGGGGRR
jgi:hypothetical protein